MIEDATAAMFLYFFVIEQMHELVDSDEFGAPTGDKHVKAEIGVYNTEGQIDDIPNGHAKDSHHDNTAF